MPATAQVIVVHGGQGKVCGIAAAIYPWLRSFCCFPSHQQTGYLSIKYLIILAVLFGVVIFFISAVIVSDDTVLCTSKFENVQLLLVCMFCMSDIFLCIYYGNKPCFLFELSSQLLLVFFLLKLEQAFDQVY